MSLLNPVNTDNPPTSEPLPLEPTVRPLQYYNALSLAQAGSGLLFSTVIITHSAAILLAPIGGIDLSNRLLVLGRVYYQDSRLGPVLLAGGLGVHVITGIAKIGLRKHLNHVAHHHEALTATSPLPYHRETGYALAPLLAIHYVTTRLLPSMHFRDSAFLDYTYISLALRKAPVISYTFHLALAGVATYHIISGFPMAWQRVFMRHRKVEAEVQPNKSYADALKDTNEIPKRKAKAIQGRKIRYTVVGGLVGGFASALWVFGKVNKIPLREEYAGIWAKIGLRL